LDKAIGQKTAIVSVTFFARYKVT